MQGNAREIFWGQTAGNEDELCILMKKNYSTPRLTELTPKQAHKIIAEKKKITEEAAAALIEELRGEERAGRSPDNEHRNHHKKSA